MSAQVVSALGRERRRLTGLADVLNGRIDTPASVVALVRSAAQDLAEAEGHSRALLAREGSR